jgi:hypothetical protein
MEADPPAPKPQDEHSFMGNPEPEPLSQLAPKFLTQEVVKIMSITILSY